MEQDNKTTANEPMIAYGANSYADVMCLLYTMPITPEVKERVGRRLVKEVSEPALANAFAKIDELGKLEDGWAGDGSYAISKRVLNNLKRVLLISENDDWTEWMIGPDVNATVGLQSKKNRAIISLGTDEYSYYVRKNGKRMGNSHIKFTPESFLNVMHEIA
ncbi:MAG: hypothetical protein J6W19_02395 [Prevotella sp.]|nr:hypothetical protein [Prevotella sp.]